MTRCSCTVPKGTGFVPNPIALPQLRGKGLIHQLENMDLEVQ